MMTKDEIRNGLIWNNLYHNFEDHTPKFNNANREIIKNTMTRLIDKEIIPLLDTALNKEIPDEENKHDIINGYMCRSFYIITSNIKKELGIESRRKGKKIQFRNKSSIEDIINEKEERNDTCKKIVTYIKCIDSLRKSEELNEADKQNKETEILGQIMKEAEKIPMKNKKDIFGTETINYETVKDMVNDTIKNEEQTNIYKYMENAINDVQNLKDREKKIMIKKARELFELDPERAIRYYVNPKDSKTCSIPINEIYDELYDRWKEVEFNEEMADEWKTEYRIEDENKEVIMKEMQDEETFKFVIDSRNVTSAHGTDGIGYWALKAYPKGASKMMAMLSKIILKYGFMPSTWNSSRTVLIYKKGDEMLLKNWRPLTITSCLYRVWTCALAHCLQEVNQENKIFDPNQKGFIRGIDGCLEHSNMISEVIADSNRSRRNLYIITIDLKDAFGSLSHQYIRYMLKETNLPEEIQEVVMRSYEEGFTKVRINYEESNKIPIHKGVKQGCPVSPLIFNLCMNPLLKKIDEECEGYRIGNTKIAVQAYADDLVLFSETREGMEQTLRIVEKFLDFAKVEVNADKCHSMTYVLVNRTRTFDDNPFYIFNRNIPNETLAAGVEYLGTEVATTRKIRNKGYKAIIEETKDMIIKIGNSVLLLNQKVYAIKTFAIPKLDFLLINGRVTQKEMKEIDCLVRKTIKKDLKTNSIPNDFFYTHWKDGGLSIQPLKERERALKARTLIALYNSRSTKVYEAMRYFTDGERRYRKINRANTKEEMNFLNWNVKGKTYRGTDSIIMHAKRAADKIGVKILINEDDRATLVYKDENDDIIEDTYSKTVMKALNKIIRKKHHDGLMNNNYSGHSFKFIQDSDYANYFMGDYRNRLNDNIRKWIIKARCNALYTGSVAEKKNNDNGNRPHCPYCGTTDKDTLMHRLNGCKGNLSEQTIRHDNVQYIILSLMSKKYKSFHFMINRSVNIEGKHLEEPYNRLKPDIVGWDSKRIFLVEFSIPYANISHGEDSLEKVYNEKRDKYQGLVERCSYLYKRKVKLFVIVVSSLGAIYKKSMKDINKLLKFNKKSKDEKKTVYRRLSITACIFSYFIFNKLDQKRLKNFKRRMENERLQINNDGNEEDDEMNRTMEEDQEMNNTEGRTERTTFINTDDEDDRTEGHEENDTIVNADDDDEEGLEEFKGNRQGLEENGYSGHNGDEVVNVDDGYEEDEGYEEKDGYEEDDGYEEEEDEDEGNANAEEDDEGEGNVNAGEDDEGDGDGYDEGGGEGNANAEEDDEGEGDGYDEGEGEGNVIAANEGEGEGDGSINAAYDIEEDSEDPIAKSMILNFKT
jgi:hypothetical protein